MLTLSDIVPPPEDEGPSEAWQLVAEYNPSKEEGSLDSSFASLSVKNLGIWLRFLELVVKLGPRGIPSACVHEADKEGGIWEFKKGDFRLYWFYGEGEKIVVCSHFIRKSTQKTELKHKKRARKFKDEYFQAIKNEDVEVINRSWDDE